MARRIKILKDLTVQRLKEPGLYLDGAGLYLRVSDSGSKSWVFRYTSPTKKKDGKGVAREMGLGALHARPLAKAREKAAEARACLADGKDPIDEKDAQEASKALERARTKTFDECAKQYIADKRLEWRCRKQAPQWEASLKRYVPQHIGSRPVSDIDTAMVLEVLEPIWREKTETASRVRARIERILAWATVKKYRTGDNPARWDGHLKEAGLPKRSLIAPVVHHAALPYGDMPDFLPRLRSQHGIAPLALEFLILTATRTGETIGARWDEIDSSTGVWTIPKSRMKAGVEHKVPLSARTVEILREMHETRDATCPFVFPGARAGRPLSNMAFLQLLRRMEAGVTAHGFRSTFRDWAGEQTSFPFEVAEAALAHKVGDKTVASYLRGTFFGKRRQLMDAWAAYCTRPAARASNVTNIRARAEA